MDVVYIVGNDKAHNHIELKYSIRSLYKYLDRIDRLFIVGVLPSFLRDVVHIPAIDRFPNNAGRNIYDKMIFACRHPELSAHFLCAADDHFLLKSFSLKRYPYFYIGGLWDTINALSKESKFKPYVEATFWALHERGLPTKNFNSHLPMVFQKDIFIELMDSFNWDLKKSMTVKGLYPNALKIPGVKISDCKIATPKTKTAIYRALAKNFFFSTNEHSINEAMLEVLEELYPNRSPWEYNDPSLLAPAITVAELRKKTQKE